ncbi:DUF3703 domain-containing protein [Pleionea litopenaei]|uniref:DUF3703 domain-containing protein n=1 Tax=Pleionea litopenaei TaxID=3070815 RepID=A0AA51RUT9_9GAMM|nr:DUF3703 domain-containing protein [Pleionea sp. HL-JVS1]WMS87883.1 DUF3703 domain-containing protein [Pleionea sp. HL-JVS1]
MTSYRRNIGPFVEREIAKSLEAQKKGHFDKAFSFLENAHVLGQPSTYWHIKVHYLMLVWGIKQKDFREVWGQVIRLIGAALLTAVKGVPEGNTGGSNVSPLKPMRIDPNLANIIQKAKNDKD